MGKISKVYIPSDEEFNQIIANASCYNDCIKALGLSISGGGHTTDILKRRIEELNCDISHFKNTITGQTQKNKRYSLEEILISNSPYTSTSKLKDKLIKAKVLEYKCAICGNQGEWNGQFLSLQLDHIDGDNKNNNLKNLRLLCPNCHSQTNTYAGKNVDKVKNLPVTREELKKLIRTKTFTDITKEYHIADTTLRRWCGYFNLPQLKKEINSYSDEEWELL